MAMSVVLAASSETITDNNKHRLWSGLGYVTGVLINQSTASVTVRVYYWKTETDNFSQDILLNASGSVNSMLEFENLNIGWVQLLTPGTVYLAFIVTSLPAGSYKLKIR